MKIDNNLPKSKKIFQYEVDKSKLTFLNKSQPIGKKSVKKKLKTESNEEASNIESESLEVVVSQVDFEENHVENANQRKFKKFFKKFTLETIEEETLEDLEEHYESEKKERELIEIRGNSCSNENMEDLSDIDDLSCPYTDEELFNELRIPFINLKNSVGVNSEICKFSEIRPLGNLFYSCSLKEFEVRLVTITQPAKPQSCPIEEVREKKNVVELDIPNVKSELNVELESKPSSTDISISGATSDFAVSSIKSVRSFSLIDYITLKQSSSLTNDYGNSNNKTRILTIDLRATFRSLFNLVCRFLESPHLIYIVVFIGSTYITLYCVLRDSTSGSELVWNISPSLNTPFSSAAF